MPLKQIYAALDIGSYEIKLVVGEFHNTRFNVIRVERIKSQGIVNQQIVDSAAVSKAIASAVKNASDLLQVKIERVLLAIPAYHMNRISQRVTVPILHDNKQIILSDIQNAIKLAQRSQVGFDHEIVNVVPVKYIVNGIATRRLPLKEVCDVLYVDVDLLCAGKQVVYDYVRVVEQAGLEILDIFVQPYADAKEIAIFEQTVDHPILYLNIGYQTTTVSLFAQGRLASSEVINYGMQQLDKAIMNKFGVPQEAAERLKMYQSRLDVDEVEEVPIYMWSHNGETHILHEAELSDVIKEEAIDFLKQINDFVSDIFEHSKTKVVLAGGGGELLDLDKLAKQIWPVDVQSYVPETLGARSSSLVSALGLFYAYKDACEYTLSDKISVDSFRFTQAIMPKKQEEEEGFTGRLKGLLFNEAERKK